MLPNRHRGLVDLHNAATALLVVGLFWLYGELVMAWFSELVRLTREVRLLPYFLSVALGLILGWRAVVRQGPRLLELTAVEAARLAFSQTTVLALVVFAMMFATQDRSISRLFLSSFLGFAWLALTGAHLRWPRRLAAGVFGPEARVPTVVIARAGRAEAVRHWLGARAPLGVALAGQLTWEGTGPGTVAELGDWFDRRRIGQVVLWDLPPTPGAARAVVEACQAAGGRVLVRNDLEEALGHPVTVTEFEGRPYFALHEEPLEEPLNRVLKRVFDVAVALPVVVLVLPPLALAVALGQRLQSPGPLLHVRPRAGGGPREEFTMLKFRTMHPTARDDQAEVRQAARADGRVYPLGAWLRRHSLDEFPQFWNVLVGEMSLVGPRPVMPLLDAEFERQARAYRTRRLVKPGITGLAQSRGWRGEITTPEQLQERVRLDLHYIAHWSLGLDVLIALRTLWQVVRPPRSAY